MKTAFALFFLAITTSAFSCSELVGDYVCFDQYSYVQHRKISITEETLSNGQKGLAVTERGYNRYNRILRLDGKKHPVENMTIKSSCDGKVLKVTMSLGWHSDTDTFKKTKTGIKLSTTEETGKKKLDCEKL